jgi:hypothetical protein
MQGVFWFPLELFTKDWGFLAMAYYNENFFNTEMAPSTYTPIEGPLIKGQKTNKSTLDYVNSVAKNSYYTLTNPVVQDVYITCD